jgi:hypothetical protein
MTRRTPQITGPAAEQPGRPYLTHLNDLMNTVETRRDEAKRAEADLNAEIEALTADIERRNIDTQKANDKDRLEIGARQSEIADWQRVAVAAEAAIAAANEKLP